MPSTLAQAFYILRLEIDQPFDFNPYYSSNRFPDNPNYSGAGFSAQPSVIYEAIIDHTSLQQHYAMQSGKGIIRGTMGSCM